MVETVLTEGTMRMRWAVIALALVALGCGKDGDKKQDATGAESTAAETDTAVSPDTTLGIR